MSSTAAPLRGPSLASLLLTCALAIVGFSVGLNALIKSNQEQVRFKKAAPAGTTIDINVNDVYHSGVIVSVVCIIIAILSSLFALLQLLSLSFAKTARTLRLQSFSLFFLSAWLFGCLTALTVEVATREVQVTAFIGKLQLPPQIVKQVEQQLGSVTLYRKIHYLMIATIVPWFTLAATLVAAVILLLAAKRAHSTSTRANYNSEPMVERKGSHAESDRL